MLRERFWNHAAFDMSLVASIVCAFKDENMLSTIFLVLASIERVLIAMRETDDAEA